MRSSRTRLQYYQRWWSPCLPSASFVGYHIRRLRLNSSRAMLRRCRAEGAVHCSPMVEVRRIVFGKGVAMISHKILEMVENHGVGRPGGRCGYMFKNMQTAGNSTQQQSSRRQKGRMRRGGGGSTQETDLTDRHKCSNGPQTQVNKLRRSE